MTTLSKSVRAKRDELCNKSMQLKSLALNSPKWDISNEVRDKQNEIYNKFLFYNELIKAVEKHN